MVSASPIFSYLKPYRKWALLAPVLMLIEVAMDLTHPRLIQRIVDEGIGRGDMALVLRTGLLMLGLSVIGVLGGMGNGVAAEQVVQGAGADLREALFRKVQALSFGNLDRLGTGPLITRLTNDVTQLQEATMMMLRMAARGPFLMVGSLVMAILTSPQLAFIPLILIPIEVLVVVLVVRKATPLFTQVQARIDALNAVMQENLAGVRLVKAFARADREEERFGEANARLAGQAIAAMRTGATMFPFMMMTVNLGVVSVLWFGGIQVTRGTMQPGQIIAFVNYLLTTLFNLMMVSQLVLQFARAGASARRIEEVLGTEPLVVDRADAVQDLTFRGRVVFDKVSFGYDANGSEPVLKDVTFTAEPGEMVAVLGTTGAGKSSLVHLIPRFYDVTAGRVLVDGVDVREVSQEALRRHIGVVLQEAVLFSGTIRDNIRYGRPEATDAEVVAAAKAAQAHDFIIGFPDGYDTMLGQRGVNLSGGQKQRLAIARALLLKPTILILDDSTSAVDIETEAKIQDALEEQMQHCTSFVIAQRVSTVLKADKILILDEGRIAAEGTHETLLATSPIYREICASQLGNGVNGNE